MNETIKISDLLKDAAEPFEKVNGYSLDFKSECLYARQQIMKDDWSLKAAQNAPSALKGAILNVAAIGISLNPATAHAYLVPRSPKKGAPPEICLDISYRGLVKLATDAGAIEWAKAVLVYEGDKFVWRGPATPPDHEADVFAADRMDASDPLNKLKGGYCIAKLTTGEYMVDTMTAAEIAKVKSTSKAENGPWKTWPEEMAKKTLVKRASKSWPQSSGRERMDTAVQVINQHEGLHETEPVDEEKIHLFLDLVAKGEPLPLLNFTRSITPEESDACFNAAPKGEKTKFKQRARELETEAHKIIDDYVTQISEHCENSDPGALELYDELTEMERELVDARLPMLTIRQFEMLRKDAA